MIRPRSLAIFLPIRVVGWVRMVGCIVTGAHGVGDFFRITAHAVLALFSYAMVEPVEAQQAIRDPLKCPQCEIRLTKLVTIQDSITYSPYGMWSFARDTRGRFYVGPSPAAALTVYDANGHFSELIGKNGRGPQEFSRPFGFALGARDSIYIFAANHSGVFDSAYRWVRQTKPLPAQTFLVFPGNDGSLIAGFNYPMLGHAGYPLHIIDKNGTILRSFGAEAPAYQPGADLYGLVRVADRDKRGHIWTSRLSEYLLEQWDTTGRRLAAFRRSVPWFTPYRTLHTQQDYLRASRVEGLRIDATGKLWTLVMVPREKPLDTVAKGMLGPELRAYTLPEHELLFQSIIEVIDPADGRVIIRSRLPHHMLGFFSGDLLLAMREIQSGEMVIDVWRVELIQPSIKRSHT